MADRDAQQLIYQIMCLKMTWLTFIRASAGSWQILIDQIIWLGLFDFYLIDPTSSLNTAVSFNNLEAWLLLAGRGKGRLGELAKELSQVSSKKKARVN